MKIITVHDSGSAILRRRSNPVPFAAVNLNQLIQDMFETMTVSNGMGLAAPQIGRNLRLFVMQLPELEQKVFINPKYLSKSEQLIEWEEGCLSIPGILGVVRRHEWIEISYLNREGEPCTLTAMGIESCVIQHEIDHLDGRLFTDHALTTREIPHGTSNS